MNTVLCMAVSDEGLIEGGSFLLCALSKGWFTCYILSAVPGHIFRLVTGSVDLPKH
jgi:hypothetical protein